MATHEDRVKRMVEQGIISEQQGEKLRNSLGVTNKLDTEAILRSKKSYAALFGIMMVLIVVIGIFTLLMTSNVTEVSEVKYAMHDIGGSGMNKLILVISGFILVLVMPIMIWILTFNSLVSSEEQVIMSWAQVESNFQRRSDLIPVLVESVSRYLQHEKETFKEVTEKRNPQGSLIQANLARLIEDNDKSAKVRQSLSGKPPTDQITLEQLGQIEEQIGLSMRKLIAVVEDYPELRSSEQFITLQAQLEGTENRINVARIRFNESVQTYNGSIRRFPGSLVGSVGDFKRKAYFKSEVGADKAVKLDFK